MRFHEILHLLIHLVDVDLLSVMLLESLDELLVDIRRLALIVLLPISITFTLWMKSTALFMSICS